MLPADDEFEEPDFDEDAMMLDDEDALDALDALEDYGGESTAVLSEKYGRVVEDDF